MCGASVYGLGRGREGGGVNDLPPIYTDKDYAMHKYNHMVIARHALSIYMHGDSYFYNTIMRPLLPLPTQPTIQSLTVLKATLPPPLEVRRRANPHWPMATGLEGVNFVR